MPNGGAEILDKAHAGEVDPLTITAFQYDLVLSLIHIYRRDFGTGTVHRPGGN